MSDLTEKQRAALTALAELMEEHEITFTSSPSEFTRSIGVGRYLVFTSLSANPVSHHAIKEILEQEQEPTPEPAGFEGTMSALDDLCSVRKK